MGLSIPIEQFPIALLIEDYSKSGAQSLEDLQTLFLNSEFLKMFNIPSMEEGIQFSKKLAYFQTCEEIEGFSDRKYSREIETTIIDFTGKERTISISKAVTDLGDSIRIISSFTDLSIRKMIEKELIQYSVQLEGMNRDLEEFNYTLSHEFKNPLATIKGFLEVITQELHQEGSDMAEFAEIALNNSEYLNVLVDRLLKNIQTPDSSFQWVDIIKVLAKVEELLKLEIINADAKIIRNVKEKMVFGDISLLVQLFQNIISNALKYRSEEPPEIIVSNEITDEGWQFSIKDNGIGIDQHNLSKIFELFTRAHQDTNREGSGIGLAIVKEIVNKHNGKVWAESTPGKGSTFYFNINPPR